MEEDQRLFELQKKMAELDVLASDCFALSIGRFYKGCIQV